MSIDILRVELEGLRALEARAADGSGNNMANAAAGMAGAEFIRLAGADYADGIGSPVDRGDARAISNVLIGPAGEKPNSSGVDDLFTFFGQLLDHDLDLAAEGSGSGGEKIQFTTGEDPTAGFSGVTLGINRTNLASAPGEAREHANTLTSHIDASNIYGSDTQAIALLRATLPDGSKSAFLATSSGGNLPTFGQLKGENPDVGEGAIKRLIGGPVNDGFYVAGDLRENENTALTTLHTVWMREHNYQAARLAGLNPGWTQDEVFEAAKIIVEAEMQHVVFKEWLPLLVGGDHIQAYAGYRDTVDDAVSHEFATAAFRLGHSLLPNNLQRLGEDGKPIAQGNAELFQSFFRPDEYVAGGGADPLLRGLLDRPAQELDSLIVDDVRQQLFGDRARDLAVLNILRGRDHGLADFNGVREALGLGRLESFAQLTSDTVLQAGLAEVYASIDNFDLWVGGLIENDAAGSQLGETLQAIVLDQFLRARDGDRFYYETRLQDMPALLAEIEATRFSDILKRSTGIEHIQDDAFVAHDRVMGTAHNDLMRETASTELIMGGDGNDTVMAGGGDDDVFGDAGIDKLYGGLGRDMLDGGAGGDKLYGDDGDDDLRGSAGNDLLHGENGDDRVRGGDGNDSINGGLGQDDLGGGEGDDKILAGAGSDRVAGDAGDDTLDAGYGDDEASGGEGDDLILGGMGNDRLSGDGGVDTLRGGQGDDRLAGGAGSDTLSGELGGDVFVFAAGDGRDRITDFRAGAASGDVVEVHVPGFSSLADIKAAAVDTSGGLLIDFGGGDELKLTGVKEASLTDGDFTFV